MSEKLPWMHIYLYKEIFEISGYSFLLKINALFVSFGSI
jgi:hypothetical protein